MTVEQRQSVLARENRLPRIGRQQHCSANRQFAVGPIDFQGALALDHRQDAATVVESPFVSSSYAVEIDLEFREIDQALRLTGPFGVRGC